MFFFFFFLPFFLKRLTTIHSHTDGVVNHTGRQPARSSQVEASCSGTSRHSGRGSNQEPSGPQWTRPTPPAILSPPLTYGLIQGEAVVDSRRQRDQVAFPHGDPDPSVAHAPDVKVGLAIQDVADLVVQVEVLLEEHLQLLEEGRRAEREIT